MTDNHRLCFSGVSQAFVLGGCGVRGGGRTASETRSRSSVPSLCLRSSFAPEGGQKAAPKRLYTEATPTPKPACQSDTDRYALQCNSSKNIPSIAKESHAFEGVMAFQVGQLLQVLFADYKSPLLSQGSKSQSTTFSFLIPS